MGLKYEDYAHLAKPQEEKVDEEISEAQQQQEDRQESTPDLTDWEKRYKDLEVAYSRQGQQIGEYRKLVDDYLNSTPEPEETQEVNPITSDDIFDDPNSAVARVVENHPAIKRVTELEKELAQTRADAAREAFRAKHPGFDEAVSSPEFANWVNSDQTRIELAQRADKFDMIAADALFSLYEAEHAKPASAQPVADEVSLESGSGAEPPAPERYSRSEMLRVMTRAKQGDMQAQEYYKAHAKAYREAVIAGNVRD